MADFISHHLFGEQMLSVLPNSARQAFLRHPVCFRWGLQGPDPLFYRHIALGSPLHKLGNRMHSERTATLFDAMSQAVRSLTGDRHVIAEAYFYGFLCHYALDATIHPYVYCRQEQIRAVDPSLSASAVHCQIESDIDFLLCRSVLDLLPTEFEPGRYYRLHDDELATLAVLLHAVICRVYGVLVSTHELRGAFREMLPWEDFLYSDSRLLYQTAQKVERLVGHGAMLTGHMKVEVPDWDALNLERAPWHNLWAPDEERTDTVLELLESARGLATHLTAQYAVTLRTGAAVTHHFACGFDNGSPKRIIKNAEA